MEQSIDYSICKLQPSLLVLKNESCGLPHALNNSAVSCHVRAPSAASTIAGLKTTSRYSAATESGIRGP